MKSNSLINFFFAGILILFIYACSKDRLIVREEQSKLADPYEGKVFESVYTMPLFSKLASTSEKITVKSASDIPLITKKGTKLWLYNTTLRTAQLGAVSYPFDVEIIELYTFKDMILHRKPTSSFNQMLVTGGAIYLKVSKNGVAISPNIYSPASIEIPAKRIENNMWLFYEGNDKQERFTWTEAPKDTTRGGQEKYPFVVGNKTAYQIFPRQYGWINCDKFNNYSGPKTKITFTSLKPPIENIVVFMVFPNINSVIRVYEGKSFDVPIGEEVTIVAVAQTDGGEIFSFFKNIKIEDKQTVEITLTVTTEQEFLDTLGKL